MSADPTRRIRVALLFGGRSPEHEVSLTSARSVRQALDPARFDVVPMAIDRAGRWLPSSASQRLLAAAPDAASGEMALVAQHAGELPSAPELKATVDVVLPMLHGPFGEDGTVQGLLELLNVPYVGAGVAASAVGMDKVLMKQIFLQHGLPVLPFAVVRQAEWRRARTALVERLLRAPGLPCFVKPANMGSSIGISKVTDEPELAPALDLAFTYDLKVLVEQGVPGYRELECAVLGNEEPQASVIGEILIESDFYDYETKYTEGAAKLVAPASVRAETSEALQAYARCAFQAIDAAGMARVDFLVSPDESAIWLSEINTIPGFTPYSMYPLLWQASGLGYPELIARLVDLAIERHALRAALQRVREPDGAE